MVAISDSITIFDYATLKSEHFYLHELDDALKIHTWEDSNMIVVET
jgi:hypothetical protein